VTGEPRLTIARDGYPLIGGAFTAAVVTAVAASLSEGRALSSALAGLAAAFAVIGVFLLNFFRDPRRTAPEGTGLVISPADGRVIAVEPDVQEPRFLAGRAAKISIFMSPLDVHVNRSPLEGLVTGVHYHPGKYFAAFSDKASLDNEQNAIVMEARDGRSLVFIQIAGFVARRIVCRVKPGDRLGRGQRVGMIKLGSRVDIFVPGGLTLRVGPGDRVRAGETVLGVLV
jgi:phosphatidylserine decarboxylase